MTFGKSNVRSTFPTDLTCNDEFTRREYSHIILHHLIIRMAHFNFGQLILIIWTGIIGKLLQIIRNG